MNEPLLFGNMNEWGIIAVIGSFIALGILYTIKP